MGQSGHYLKVYKQQMQKTSLWLSGGKGEGKMNWEIETEIYSVVYIKQITNKNLCFDLNLMFYNDLYENRI